MNRTVLWVVAGLIGIAVNVALFFVVEDISGRIAGGIAIVLLALFVIGELQAGRD